MHVLCLQSPSELDSEATIYKESKNDVDATPGYNVKTLTKQFPILLDKEAGFEWFDIVEVNEILVPDLNEAIISLKIESISVIIEDSFGEQQ